MRGALEQIFSLDQHDPIVFHVKDHPSFKLSLKLQIDQKFIPFLIVKDVSTVPDLYHTDRKAYLDFDAILHDVICQIMEDNEVWYTIRISKTSKPLIMEALINIEREANLIKE